MGQWDRSNEMEMDTANTIVTSYNRHVVTCVSLSHQSVTSFGGTMAIPKLTISSPPQNLPQPWHYTSHLSPLHLALIHPYFFHTDSLRLILGLSLSILPKTSSLSPMGKCSSFSLLMVMNFLPKGCRPPFLSPTPYSLPFLIREIRHGQGNLCRPPS